MPKKRKRASRRRTFWTWPAHLREGRILHLDRKKYSPGMVRVRVMIL
jgi:hypothetical protein